MKSRVDPALLASNIVHDSLDAEPGPRFRVRAIDEVVTVEVVEELEETIDREPRRHVMYCGPRRAASRLAAVRGGDHEVTVELHGYRDGVVSPVPPSLRGEVDALRSQWGDVKVRVARERVAECVRGFTRLFVALDSRFVIAAEPVGSRARVVLGWIIAGLFAAASIAGYVIGFLGRL